MVRIWYPIEKKQYNDYYDYMDYFTFQWLKNRSPVPLITIPNHAYTFVHPHLNENIPLIDNNQLFPIIIFSPGYDGNFEIYTSLIEDLVSNGFIIISMNHPYVSGLTVFPDGRKIPVESIKPYSFTLA